MRIILKGKTKILALLLLFLAPFVSGQKKLSVSEQNRFDYYFFEAQRLKNSGQSGARLDALLMCMEIDSTQPELQSEMGFMYIQMNRLKDAERSFAYAAESDPGNWWYQWQYIRTLIHMESYEEAIVQTERLKTHFPQRDEVYELLSTLYKETGEYGKAIDELNQLEVYTGIEESLSLDKFQLYLFLNKEKKALHEIIRLAQKYPYESRYQVLLGDIYLELKQPKKAIKLYRQVLKADPDNPYVHVSLSDYYKRQNKEDEANEAIISALKNEKMAVENKMDILSNYVDRLLSNSKDIEETEELFKLLVDMYPLNEKTHTYYALFLQNQKRNEEALDVLESILNINGKDEFAWRTSLQILLEKDDFPAVIELTNRGLSDLPLVPEFYYYRSVAFYQQEEKQKALEAAQLGIRTLQASVSPLVLSNFYGQVGDIYHNLEDKEQSFYHYERALELNPGNIYVMNNYAYFLSEEDQDLRKAERMSAKTVEAEPDNSTYLDTYAWIFYKQGDYSLARIYIEKAVEYMKEDEPSDVILEHCGDIYRALDDLDKSLEMWIKAYELNPQNSELRDKIVEAGGEIPEIKTENNLAL